MKKIIIIILLVVLSLFVLDVIKDQAIKSIVTVGASTVTGTPVEIDGLSLNLFRQSIEIRGFRMYNPEGFPEGILIDIPKIIVDYNLGALFKRKLHLRKIDIDLKEIGVIKNSQGLLNVDALKVIQDTEKPAEPKQDKPKKKLTLMAMQIDILTFSVGEVVYKDFTVGDTPSVLVYEVGIESASYNNITSAQQLVAILLSASLKNTAIKGASVYGAATLLGVGFLPAGLAVTLAGEDSAQAEFTIGFDKVYEASLAVLNKTGIKTGEVKNMDKTRGTLLATVNKNKVTVKIEKISDRKTQVSISARRLMLPKPEVARGVLRQISDALK